MTAGGFPPLAELGISKRADRLVLDGGGVRKLAERTSRALALLRSLRERDLCPAIVPAVVLPECLTGDAAQDEAVNRFLAGCDLREEIPAAIARRAAWLRTAAGRGTACDAVVVAMAEPGGAILSGGRRDLEALALFADGVMVERG